MKTFLLVSLVLASTMTPALAQIPVTDTASIAKAVEQLTAWKRQYDQMLSQISVSKGQLQAMTGSRNLGAIVDNVSTTSGVPQDIVVRWRELNRHEQLLQESMARTQQALEITQARGTQVRALMNAMNGTNDAKSAAELQGRISAEVAFVVNDLQRVQLMNIERQNNHERLIEKVREENRIQRAKPLATW